MQARAKLERRFSEASPWKDRYFVRFTPPYMGIESSHYLTQVQRFAGSFRSAIQLLICTTPSEQVWLAGHGWKICGFCFYPIRQLYRRIFERMRKRQCAFLQQPILLRRFRFYHPFQFPQNQTRIKRSLNDALIARAWGNRLHRINHFSIRARSSG